MKWTCIWWFTQFIFRFSDQWFTQFIFRFSDQWFTLFIFRFSEQSAAVVHYISCVLYASYIWLAKIIIIKWSLRVLLRYHKWMYEVRGPMSLKTKLWVVSIHKNVKTISISSIISKLERNMSCSPNLVYNNLRFY